MNLNFHLEILDSESKFGIYFGTVFFTAMKIMKLKKAHGSPPLVDEDNSMVFVSFRPRLTKTSDFAFHCFYAIFHRNR